MYITTLLSKPKLKCLRLLLSCCPGPDFYIQVSCQIFCLRKFYEFWNPNDACGGCEGGNPTLHSLLPPILPSTPGLALCNPCMQRFPRCARLMSTIQHSVSFSTVSLSCIAGGSFPTLPRRFEEQCEIRGLLLAGWKDQRGLHCITLARLKRDLSTT